MSGRVLIAVTHLLGSGHLVRARHLAGALGAAGFSVTLVNGGMPLPGADNPSFACVQLPPVRVEGVDFRNLLDEAGAPVTPDRRMARAAVLAELATSLAPDVVITEHFPFGRRQLAAEFLGLIAAAKAANPRALVLASIRDVLVAPRADRIVEAQQRIAEHVDAVLIHGDKAFLPLDASWPVVPELAAKLHYTGYLTAPSPYGHQPEGENNDGSKEIVVSGGGSGAALPLFDVAMEAARLAGPDRRWRLLAGRGLPEADFARLQSLALGHVTVERARPDFPALLERCALSISQAGYNTVLDLLEARKPAIVVPFDAGDETEQTIRAQAMQRAGLACCLPLTGPDALTPQTLNAAVAAALHGHAAPTVTIDRDGAAKVAGLVRRLMETHR